MTGIHDPHRPDDAQRPRIVVGVDGSEPSKQALRWAAHLADATGARIEAVAAWEIPTAYGLAAMPLEWSPRQDMDKALTETVDEVFGSERPGDLQLSLCEGHAARVLIEQSAGALMVVVGSRGHGGFAGLLLGSVSANVAEHAGCPVLVAHGDQIPPKVTS